MSTRACIARPDGAGWRGVYVHRDGDPTRLGRRLLRAVRRAGAANVVKLLESTPQGFLEFPGEPYPLDELPSVMTSDDDPAGFRFSDRYWPRQVEWIYLVEEARLTVFAKTRWGCPYHGSVVGRLDTEWSDADELLAGIERYASSARRLDELLTEEGEWSPFAEWLFADAERRFGADASSSSLSCHYRCQPADLHGDRVP